MQIGFIGTGSMGSILLEAFIASKALLPSQIVIHNRTLHKAERLAERFPGVKVTQHNVEVAERSTYILLCVKPLEYKNALEQALPGLRPDQTLITITSPVSLWQLEQLIPCAVARVVPSITNAARSGVTLCEYGSRIKEETRQEIISLFSKISHPIEVEESFLRIASDISSCGPAFLSYTLQQMIEAASVETGLSRDAATYLTTQMIIGMAELLKQEVFSLPALQERVCVPGGITGEGLTALEEGLPGVFNQVFQRTHAKFAEDRQEVSKHLGLTLPPNNSGGEPLRPSQQT